MIGLVSAGNQAHTNSLAPILNKSLLTVELTLDYHSKYLSPEFKRHTVHPEMSRKIGEALLAAGAITIVENGPANAQDAKDGYRNFTVRVAAINPLSRLAEFSH